MRKKCRSRAAVEPVIEHVKHDYLMARNYLKGTIGDDINANLATAGFNFRGLLNKIKEAILWPHILINKIRNYRKVQQVYF